MEEILFEERSANIMTSELQKAIDNGYEVFSGVPKPRVIDGCSCCLDEKGIDPLLKKTLRSITPDELSEYASSVYLTVGSDKDFFYFLPRILEILAIHSRWWPNPNACREVSHKMGKI